MYDDSFAFCKILIGNSKRDNNFNHVVTLDQRVASAHCILFGCD
jgi:hypothetical protein